MTIPRVSMTCDQVADRLADFLERDVDEATRAAIEAHALACAECGQLLADLRTLRLTAANLPELAPSRDLWKGIADRIETPVVELKNGSATYGWSGTSQRGRQVWLGLAAAGLVAMTATITHELTKRSIGVAASTNVASTAAARPITAPFQSSAGTPASTQSVGAASTDSAPSIRRSVPAPTATLASTAISAQQTYDDEIARLRLVVEKRRPQLDSATVAVIEHNLNVIDDAIRQCKQALRKDPGSRFLMEALNDALDNKVQLLRTAATLPSKA
jgi:hypothetical protein